MTQLFDFIRMLVGRIRGGLGHVTVLTHLVFSGVSGAALADIGALGKIQIDMMREQGYDDDFSVGICMAAATLGPIFPPSIPLVIFAMAAEISPVKVLLAGVIPSLIIALFLMLQIAITARRTQSCPTRCAMREPIAPPAIAPTAIVRATGQMMMPVTTNTATAIAKVAK